MSAQNHSDRPKADDQAPTPEAKAREHGERPEGARHDDERSRDALHRPGLEAMNVEENDRKIARQWVGPGAMAIAAIAVVLLIIFLVY